MRINPRTFLVVLLVLLAATVVGAGGFVYWASDAAQPMPEALAAMKSDEFVRFSERNSWLVFQPENQSGETRPLRTGLILYPGGKVDYRAYAPVARAIAAQGYLVVIPSMPLNLAFLNANVAGTIIQSFPEIQHWAVGGHSLGGVAASTYAASNPQQVQGIVFWASYPAGDIKNYPGRIVSISGTRDGLATLAKIEAERPNLPAATEYVEIEGGNHGQFGYYGAQQGDAVATISREEQTNQVVTATVNLLQRISKEN